LKAQSNSQTWEDPSHTHAETKAKGDNDPLDVCEIGEAVGYTGQVKQVKILGIMALLDEGETDWKIIVIDVNDPLAPKLNDIEDVERHLPGLFVTCCSFLWKIGDYDSFLSASAHRMSGSESIKYVLAICRLT